MSSLFDLAGDALAVQRRIDEIAQLLESDDPAEVAGAVAALEQLIDINNDTLRAAEEKADGWCWAIDRLRAQAAAQAEHAKRLAAMAKAAEQQADQLQGKLIETLLKIDPEATGWKLPEHKISSRKSVAVELDPMVPADALPKQFQRVRVEANKTAIKEALQAGQDVEGAELVERRSWKIA